MDSMINNGTYGILEWTLCAAAITLTAGRYLVRWHYLKRAKLDDLFHGLALVALVVFVAMDYVSWYSPDPVVQLNTTLASDMFLWLSLHLVKASFLVLIRSIFNVSARFQRVWWAVVLWTSISFLVCEISELWQCGNPSDFGNFEVCNEPSAFSSLAGRLIRFIFHLSSDLLILVLPMFEIRKLRMSTAKKISVAAVFALTIIDIIAGIIRNVAGIVCLTTNDWDGICNDINGIGFPLEPCLAVIVCALPAYRVMLPSSQKRNNEAANLRRNAASMGRAESKGSRSIPISEDTISPISESEAGYKV